jgi:hypothetical protein
MSTLLESEGKSYPRFLFSQPRALQWFEDGKLVRRQDGK